MSAALLTVLVGLPLFGTALTVLIRRRWLDIVAMLGIPLINAAAAVYMLMATIDGMAPTATSQGLRKAK